jgi:uncharacterized Fe-S cluster-containing radical SAM superfamily enzyme
MSNRRPQRPLNDELRDLEQELASLTLRVSDIRNRINLGVTPTSSPLSIGDRVRFNIVGQGRVEGVIVATTAQRVRIQQDTTSNIYLRAPHKVTRLNNGGGNHHQ